MPTKTAAMIKQHRAALELTQVQLAQFIGVAEHVVQSWEAGTSTPAPQLLESLIIKFSRCSDPLDTGCTNERTTTGLYSGAPICQDCFDGLHDCTECGLAILEQDEHGTLSYCVECAESLGVEQ